jgi:hypothetical protein
MKFSIRSDSLVRQTLQISTLFLVLVQCPEFLFSLICHFMVFEERNRYIRSTLNQIPLSVPDYVTQYGICLLQIDSSAILDDRYAP